MGGDFSGDWYQDGGTIVVEAGTGKLLFSYIQEDPTDHAEPDDVLRALGIQASVGATGGASGVGAEGGGEVPNAECQDTCKTGM